MTNQRAGSRSRALGDLLAQLAHGPAAAGTRRGRRVDDAGARQVLPATAGVPACAVPRCCAARSGCCSAVRSSAAASASAAVPRQFGQRQLQLFEPGAALRRGTEPLPAQPGDLQLQALDLQVENPLRLLRDRRLGLGRQPGLRAGQDHRVRFGEVGGQRVGGGRRPRLNREIAQASCKLALSGSSGGESDARSAAASSSLCLPADSASCAGVIVTVPSATDGQRNRPRSRRLANRHRPWPSCQRIFIRSPRRPRKDEQMTTVRILPHVS